MALGRRVARDSVYEDLCTAIVEWQLRPGERLSEESLAEGLGVSRTPVREALHRLAAERLVVRNSAGTLTVAEVSEEDVRNMFSVRAALERVAVRDATLNATDDDLEAMDQAMSFMAVAVEVGDTRLVAAYGRDFHRLIRRASRNRICISLLEQLQPHVDRYRTLTTGFDVSRPKDALEDHRAVLEALKNRDANLCERLISHHTVAGREVAIRALRAFRKGTIRDLSPVGGGPSQLSRSRDVSG